jgi:predicted transcriptional regulator
MSTVEVKLPDSLYRQIQQLAERDGISVDQFLATAAAEKLSALLTTEYLAERAVRAGSREEFLRLLDKVPDVEPGEYDRL